MEMFSMKSKFFITIIILIAIGYSQDSQGGQPYGLTNTLSRITPVNELPNVDINALLLEDSEKPPGTPFRYGIRIPVDSSPINSGIWDILPDGTKIWRFHISSRNAFALSLIFDSFHLPEGSKLYLYNPDNSIIFGAYTSLNNSEDEIFATPLLKGEELIIEYSEPPIVKEEYKLHIEFVVHDYKDVLNFYENRDRECGVNVVCSEADPFVDQYSAAAWLDMGGWICSGAMINNTNQDLTPYFLTADHCVDGLSPGVFRFYFNYETTSCGGTYASYGSYAYGSTLRSRSYSMDPDFALLEINGSIYDSWGVYYAGWNRSSSAPTISCGVHHPSGNPKKINFDNDQASSWYWDFPTYSHWQVYWDEGGTEGGSSGSPLYDDDGRIVGQLSGGPEGACGDTYDLYGKLSRAWDGSSSSTRLRDWLDPTDSGVTYLNGTYNGYSPELTVGAPNGGETLEAGSTFGINWDDNIEENVSIKLYRNGSFISTIASSTSSDGYYNWSISESLEESNYYKVKITSVSDPSVYDYSDDNFAITEPLGDVNVYFGEINSSTSTIDIMLTNSGNIAGYQFNITDVPDYIDLIEASGGTTEDQEFMISTSPNGTVIAFSLIGTVISPGNDILTQISYSLNDNCNECENLTICFEDPIFSNEEGLPYPVTTGGCENFDLISITPGDVNGDGVINVLDAVMVVSEILTPGGFDDNQMAAADLNSDGVINILDVVMLVNLILGR